MKKKIREEKGGKFYFVSIIEIKNKIITPPNYRIIELILCYA